jgi:hypothetical protein
MTRDVTDWKQLREFKAVDLAASFVLSWRLEAGTLRIDVDLCLLPQHAFYEPPRPSERACIRAALLEFPACTSIVDCSDNSARISVDGLGHGKIDGLERSAGGRYELSGTFGRVAIFSDRPLLRLKESML